MLHHVADQHEAVVIADVNMTCYCSDCGRHERLANRRQREARASHGLSARVCEDVYSSGPLSQLRLGRAERITRPSVAGV
jgi:hypothetical protein